MTKKSLKVMMVEDHPEYREVLQHFLDKDDDMEVVGVFGNANQALRFLQDGNDDFDGVILLDLKLPGMSGLEAMPWIKEYAPEAKVVILSQSDNETEVMHAIRRCASGYLLKSATMDEIKTGIRNVMNGAATIDPSLARYLLREIKNRSAPSHVEGKLTPREIEILSKIGDGLSQKDIAQHFNISAYTVAGHLTNIYEKLQVQNAPAAITAAFRKGILN